ncbi:MAG: phosphate acyltransferase PlsX [Nitrospirae bacterium]|nr:phosphate acyltransferase PlsX [Nitrospirota bacterium]
MRIALDAMGGDSAPAVTVRGALEAVEAFGLEVILVGDEELVRRELGGGTLPSGIRVRHTSQLVAMDEQPSAALRRKKDSSIRVAVDLVKNGEADAVVSAGNTGAAMAISFFVLGAIDGVDRPGIAAVMPSAKDPFVLIDAGATVDCRPVHLLQFGVMGSCYASTVLGRTRPTVGLLGIGEEAGKGNELTKEAFKLLSDSKLNFVGNIEGKEMFSGAVDVVVCDGFIGNVALKIGEGLVDALAKMLKQEISGSMLGKIGYMFMRAGLPGIRKKMDYAEYGGAPLLGINGVSIISHGRSTAKAIKNALRVADDSARKNLTGIIGAGIGEAMHDANPDISGVTVNAA